MMTSTGHKPGQLPKRRENTQSPVYDTLGRHAETSTLQWRTKLDGGPKLPKFRIVTMPPFLEQNIFILLYNNSKDDTIKLRSSTEYDHICHINKCAQYTVLEYKAISSNKH